MRCCSFVGEFVFSLFHLSGPAALDLSSGVFFFSCDTSIYRLLGIKSKLFYLTTRMCSFLWLLATKDTYLDLQRKTNQRSIKNVVLMLCIVSVYSCTVPLNMDEILISDGEVGLGGDKA